MPTDDDRLGELAPDDNRQDQPERDDLIDPDDVDAEPVDEPTMDEEVGSLPSSLERPESQGFDVLDAPHRTEDASTRPLLSDERAEQTPGEDPSDGHIMTDDELAAEQSRPDGA